MNAADTIFHKNPSQREFNIGLPPKSPAMVGSKTSRKAKTKRNSSPQGIINDPFMQTAFLIHENFKYQIGSNILPSYNSEEIIHYTEINRNNQPRQQQSEEMNSSRKSTPSFVKSESVAPLSPQHIHPMRNIYEGMQDDTSNPNLLLSPQSEGKFPKLRPINVCKRSSKKNILSQLKKQLVNILPNSNDVSTVRSSQQSLIGHQYSHSNSTPDLKEYLQQRQKDQQMTTRESFQATNQKYFDKDLLLKQSKQHLVPKSNKKSGSALHEQPIDKDFHLTAESTKLNIPKSQGSSGQKNLAKSQSQPNGLKQDDQQLPMSSQLQESNNNYQFKLYMRHNYIRSPNDQQVQLETVIRRTETYNKTRRKNQISIVDSVNLESNNRSQRNNSENNRSSQQQQQQQQKDFSLPKIAKDNSNDNFQLSQNAQNLQLIIQQQQQKYKDFEQQQQQLQQQQQPQQLKKVNQFRNRYLGNTIQRNLDSTATNLQTKRIIQFPYNKQSIAMGQPSPPTPSSLRYQQQQQPSQTASKNPFMRKKVQVSGAANRPQIQVFNYSSSNNNNEDIMQELYDEEYKQYRTAEAKNANEDDQLSQEFFNVQKTKAKPQSDKLIIESRTIEDLDDDQRQANNFQQQKPIEVDEAYSQMGMSKPLYNVMSQQVLRNAIIHEDDAESCLSSRMASRK